MNSTIENNQQRILSLLAGDTISDKARSYIEELVKSRGIEKCARLTYNAEIGLSVFENSMGEQSLHYGNYGDAGRGYVDAAYCDIEQILDAAESGDEIPDWWLDESTVILVDCEQNAYGERFTTKEAARFDK